MKILLVTSDYPSSFSRHGGGLLSRRWMSQLAADNELNLLCFTDESGEAEKPDSLFRKVRLVPRPRGWLSLARRAPLLIKYPVSVAANHSPLLAKTLADLVRRERFDLVQFDNFHMGRYIRNLPDGQPRVLCLQDVAGSVLRQLIRLASGRRKFALFQEWKKTSWWEKWFCIRAHNVMVMSLKDKRTVDSWDIGVKTFILPPLLDNAVFRVRVEGDGLPDIVFLGAMHRPGNLDAAYRLHREILPLVAEKYPGIRFVIAGPDPPERLRTLAAENFIVIGPFERIEDLFSRPCILAAPLRVAGGIIVKILEAMAAGVPVVASQAANAGIGAPDEEAILLADRSRDVAGQLIRLLDNPELRARLGEGGKSFLRQRYDSVLCRREVGRIYAACAGNRA